jgi:hypothetical protein
MALGAPWGWQADGAMLVEGDLLPMGGATSATAARAAARGADEQPKPHDSGAWSLRVRVTCGAGGGYATCWNRWKVKEPTPEVRRR